ncbi:7TM diverse intracellular signaling domain-containing protein [Pedobacter gandavensis]|uniref:Chromosome partitioning protein ParA n=1 Tax=Pedobacter gandavensis TaxID=2679963 RepID=A0ABR6EQU0_9SPHI|nr:7TM diverse intracellular signaling domain-containing protein [Pedobacter gandavensis]MBB2147621.1 chromosome partitioning protein ParA [Pedobacter gandavensis]
MMKISGVVFLFTLAILSILNLPTQAQLPVKIDDKVPHHIFNYGEIESLADTSGTLTIQDILRPELASKFSKSKIYTPKIFSLNSTYWFKIKIKYTPQSRENWVLEFFDQTIEDVQVYAPIGPHKYQQFKFGAKYKFDQREYAHKNFLLNLDNSKEGEETYYIRIKSSQSASVIVVLRNMRWFVHYATEEYMFFGLFYGMIVVFSFYNLLMFIAIRQKQYLYYVLYNLSIGLYETCVDGIAFQYLWPDHPALNQYGYGMALYLSSVFGLLFTLNFLYLKHKAPLLYKAMIGMIFIRSLYFIACLYDHHLFTYKLVEVVPLMMALCSGIYIWKKGFRPARFFVIGYSFLLLGFIIKGLVLLNVSWLPYGPITHYSLSFCFVIEMILVSFAIGDSIRGLRQEQDRAQKLMIEQLQINERLKETLNKELSSLVDERTKEVSQKAATIEKQHAEISLMNAMLEKDNLELHENIKKVSRARVMSLDVDFEEFSKIYPDRDTCFKYLAELKWTNGYSCKKCFNTQHLSGFLPFSRRCTKCGYDESVIAHTIFQNSRIPINKAFYMLFLVYSTKGKISSHKLSQLLLIRQSTCWAYNSKMQKLLEEKNKELKNAGQSGWSKLIFEAPSFAEKPTV